MSAVRQADLVLEGGGVKGLGAAGAVIRLLERGFRFERVAGTSVGALAAALVAAGVDADGLSEAMSRLVLRKVPDRSAPPIAVVSEGLSWLTGGHLYQGEYVRDWLYGELAALGIRTFGDLRRDDAADDARLGGERRYKLVVMATDITHGRLLRLPWDYRRLYGLDPDEQVVADAVRMSLSIPFYFQARTLTAVPGGEVSTVVDGGVLSNFPVEVFDRTDGVAPRWPTFGVRMLPDLPEGLPGAFPVLHWLPPQLQMFVEVVATTLLGRDQTHLDLPGVRARMIDVDTSGVGVVDFGLPESDRRMLLDRGAKAVDDFLAQWNRA
ncbi:patatin-like phospholipase family protein [Amycolatopsis sp.]|uniref:patatin-like phospholipase family protein n=1 Tax=Amycolatopsis sp. TaxID=37632 RepID=UPI002C5F7230|nr:patatin-like phospholipase family protein [Amycolatopsis sp.]HVV07790.1 patatin-like phospholipase family protein [Amycolatopsis sp.]